MKQTDQTATTTITYQDRELVAQIEDRQYRVRPFVNVISPERLKFVLWLWRADYWHRDTVDLHVAEQRADFINHAATECRVSKELVESDLTLLTPYIERFRDALLTKVQAAQQQSSETLQ